MLNWWHLGFMKYGKPKAPYTIEFRIAGKRIIATADPENIKAILASQFNDYGKGEDFHNDFRDFLGDGASQSASNQRVADHSRSTQVSSPLMARSGTTPASSFVLNSSKTASRI